MKGIGRYLLLATVLLILACSCGRRGRVIPAHTFSEIYADMLAADQWLQDHSSSRRKADTTRFYAAVFKKHGYDFQDYDKSVNHYLNHPEKYVDIMEGTVKILERRTKILKDRNELLEEIKRMESYLSANSLPAIDFTEWDTVLWKVDTCKADFVILDSLMRDSLRLDSLRLDSLRLDYIKRHRIYAKRRNGIRADSLAKTR